MEEEILQKPPITNRGVVNTYSNDLKMCIDWCQATIFYYDSSIYSLFYFLFNINSSDISFEDKGLYGYDRCYFFKNIKVYTSRREDMGIHILLSGSACRDVEDLGINFLDLFVKINSLNGHYTRLDVAIDNFTNDFFTMKRVKNSIKNNLVVSRFKHTIEFIKTRLEDNSNSGYTIWFGSRASKIQIVFYDKLKERESQNQIVSENIKYWCRCEVRFRDEYAVEVVLNLLEQDFNLYIKSLLNNYIKFIVNDSYDSNRSRRPLVEWWSDFLDNVGRSRLYSNGYVQSITRKKEWLNNATSRSSAMVLLSTIDNLSLDSISCDFLIDYFNNGFKNIDFKDLQFINDYRIKHNLNPISMEDFKYIIGDIKDFLLERK